jgi:hypothetical protein
VVDPVTEDPSNKLHQQLYQPSQNIAVVCWRMHGQIKEQARD